MPWSSIAVWLISFALQMSKKGTSAAKAALISTGAAVGTYLLADPANTSNYFGVGQGETVTNDDSAGAVTVSGGAATGNSGTWSGLAGTALTTAGSVITNPNTGKNILAAGAATGSGVFDSQAAIWIFGGLAALLLLRR